MKMILLLLALLLSQAATAANRLLAIHVHPGSDGATLELRLQDPLEPAQVPAFQLIDPPQLVLDLPRTSAAEALTRTMAGSGLVRRIQLAADDERLRAFRSRSSRPSHIACAPWKIA